MEPACRFLKKNLFSRKNFSQKQDMLFNKRQARQARNTLEKKLC